MSEKLTVKQNEDSRFMLVYHDPETNIEKFFGGFYNETECPGTEDESFCFDFENWVDRPEDGAMMFKTYQEVKDFLGVVGKEEEDCVIVLYGKGPVENTILGSYWYPLKEFWRGNMLG